jgi:hypothetical protein
VTTSKELTTKASSNSEARFFVLPLRVSAGRVVRQRKRDRLEKKKNAITRLFSQVVVRPLSVSAMPSILGKNKTANEASVAETGRFGWL